MVRKRSIGKSFAAAVLVLLVFSIFLGVDVNPVSARPDWKKFRAKLSNVLDGVSAGLTAGVIVNALAPEPILTKAGAVGCGVGQGVGLVVSYVIAPSNSSYVYREIFQLQIRNITYLYPVPESSFDRALIDWIDSAVRLLEVEEAVGITYERQEAAIKDNATRYIILQTEALLSYQVQLLEQLRDFNLMTVRLSKEWSVLAPYLGLNASTYQSMQFMISYIGLPPEEIVVLKALGLTDDQIQVVKNRILAFDATAFSPDQLSNILLPLLSDCLLEYIELTTIDVAQNSYLLSDILASENESLKTEIEYLRT